MPGRGLLSQLVQDWAGWLGAHPQRGQHLQHADEGESQQEPHGAELCGAGERAHRVGQDVPGARVPRQPRPAQHPELHHRGQPHLRRGHVRHGALQGEYRDLASVDSTEALQVWTVTSSMPP